MITDTSHTLSALEALLSDVHERVGSDPVLAQTMGKAVAICRTRHNVHAGTNLQLQGVLTSLRMGWPDEAIEFIERAIDIQARWYGATEVAV